MELLNELLSSGAEVRVKVSGGNVSVDLKRRILDNKDMVKTHLVEHQEQVRLAVERLQQQGIVYVESSSLGGEIVAFVRDANVAVADGCVSYTWAELRLLSGSDLPIVHRTKQVFRGRIIEKGTL